MIYEGIESIAVLIWVAVRSLIDNLLSSKPNGDPLSARMREVCKESCRKIDSVVQFL